ncbi:major facilitator family transporter [Methylorubrum populi]|uniref:Major facilitator family transporter n=1 Tax=Methylorubrum populi TaxID=223967 RepID=A0A169QPE6_9HYPH|nr:MFS transporter [Methylorubrum populi]BAU89398.1 major facilitator family transporter [Methylorubrum populi]
MLAAESGPRDGPAGSGRLLLLYAALYGGYGALSPFLPAFLETRGLGPSEIGTLLSAGMLVRLAAGPLAGRFADRSGAVRAFLAVGLALSAALTLAFLGGQGFVVLLAVALAQAAATAPLAPLADTVALAGSRDGAVYGRVRAAGSAAFIATTVLTGHLVGVFGHGVGPLACGLLFAAGAALTRRLPSAPASANPAGDAGGGFASLAADARFRRLLLAAALVIGAHAMHDAFAVIVWQAAGIAPRVAGLLWAEAVAAEVAVFLWLGPRLIARFGPERALVLAALAGALRWAVQAQTSWLPVLVGIQALHGLTFALLHLACLQFIVAIVPEHRRATALTVYGTFGLGLASALMTLLCGLLYERFGTTGFWVMTAASLAAVPVARGLPRIR